MQDNTPIWDDEAWAALPQLSAEVETDVCVIGLGGSGLSCIGELLHLGQRVVGIDAGMIAGGAAGRNGGFLLAGIAAFHHDAAAELGSARAAALYRRTLSEIERMHAETPEAIRLVGSLRIAANADEQADCQRQFAAMRADDLPVEPYSGPEGEGLLFPTDGGFQPLRRCRSLARRLLAAGVDLFENSPALAIDGTTVQTPQGNVHAKHVIVAVDGRLDAIFPSLRDRIRTARLQMIATAPAHDVTYPRPVYTRWGYDYWQQLPDGSISFGGYRDHFLEQEWTHEREPSAEVQSALESALRTRIGTQASISHRWAASVAYRTDSVLPIISEIQPKVWAIGAYSGTGNVVGAICGRGVAHLAVRGESELLREMLG